MAFTRADSDAAVSPLKVTPLTSYLGARVEGVDAGAGLLPAVAEEIRRALLDHQVLIFPGQRLTSDEQRDFATIFGPPQPYPVSKLFGDTETVIVIDNQLIAPPSDDDEETAAYLSDDDAWHTDYTFNREIPSVGTLRAEVVPDVGGDTLWASTYAAYEALSPVMQGILDDLSAVHWSGPLFATNFGLDRFGPDARRRFDEEFPPRQHPVVITHPDTGRKALFVNPSYTTRVVGMTRGESRMLLQFLFRHLITPAFLFRHHWSIDDLVVWDERSTLHLAPTDFQPRRRRLIRVAAGSTVPSR
jgi:taurine dioxygenase